GGGEGTDGPCGTQPASGPVSVVETAAATVLPLAKGAYSLVFMDEQTLYAARDPYGFRPLVLGRLDTGWVVASETAALDIVGARFVREIAPGELVCIDGRGGRAVTFAAAQPRGGLFEYVSTAPPAPTASGPGGRPRSPAGGCTPPGSRSAGGSPPSIPRTPTWSSRCPSPGRPRRSASPRPAASRSARGWSRTPTWGGPSSSPARPSGSGASS